MKEFLESQGFDLSEPISLNGVECRVEYVLKSLN